MKLLDLLYKIPKKDLKSLDKWLESSLHYKNKSTLELYKIILITPCKNFDGVKQVVLKHKSISDTFLRTLITELTIAIENFLTYDYLYTKPFQWEFNKYKVYTELGIDEKHLEQVLSKINQLDTKNPLENYQKQYLIDHFTPVPSSQFSNSLSKIELNNFYFSEYLKLEISQYYRRENNQPLKTLNPWISIFKHNFLNQLNHPSIDIYYKLYIFITDWSSESYKQFKLSLSTSKEALSYDEQAFIYEATRNIIYNIINKGHEPILFFSEESFVLLLESIDLNFLNINGYLAPRPYYNLVISGLKLRKMDWLKEHILLYGKKLSPSIQETYIDCAWGYYHFYEKNYKKSSYHFMLMGINDDPIMLYAQIKLFQCLYERDELEVLKTRVSSFEKKLKKIEIHTSVLKHLMTQIHAIKLLVMSYKYPSKTYKLEQFMEKQNDLLFKEWYNEKLKLRL